MRKIISILLCLSMLLSVTSVFAIDATEIKADVFSSTNIVNVYGQFEAREGSIVTILLVDNDDNIKHIQEESLGKDMTYRARFKYTGEDLTSLKLRVKHGEKDITDSVKEAVAEKEPISYQVKMTNANGKTLLNTKIENFYNVPDKTYTVMLAYYNENNKLLDVFVQDTKDVEFETTTSSEEYDIPKEATDIKVFVWDKLATMVPLANEIAVNNKEEIRVLMIGHSFVEDSVKYLEGVAKADGVDIKVDYLIYGGGSFLHHWNTWTAEYETEAEAKAAGAKYFKKHYHPETIIVNPDSGLGGEFVENTTNFTKTADDFLEVYDYDYVAMLTTYGILPFDEYPSIKYTGYPNSEDDLAGQNMAKYIRERQPDAEIVLINTWAYEKQSTGHLPNKAVFGFGTTFDQDAMWEDIRKTITYQTEEYAKLKTDDGYAVSLDGKPLRYLPLGQAFNNARESVLFDTVYYNGHTNKSASEFEFVDTEHPEYKTLHRDSYHCSRNYGRYLAALVCYNAFTGNSAANNKYVHTEAKWRIPEHEAQILREAAQKAIDDSGIWN